MNLSDLSWTGNHFLDEHDLRGVAESILKAASFTIRGSSDAYPLREAIAGVFDVPVNWVTVGAGSSQVIQGLIRHLDSDLFIDVVPNFYLAGQTATTLGKPYFQLLLSPDCDLTGAVSSAGAGKSRPIVILSSPVNPWATQFALSDIVRLLEDGRFRLIVDEAYVEFAPFSLAPLVKDYDNLILVRTFSKAWGLANLRVGFCISQRLGDDFRKAAFLPYSVGELQQQMGISLLRMPGIILASIDKTIAERGRLVALLQGFSGLQLLPSSANFVCFLTDSAAQIRNAFNKQGFEVAMLHALRSYPKSLPNGLRISIVPNVTQIVSSVFRAP